MSHESKCNYIAQKAMDLVQAEKEGRDVHYNQTGQNITFSIGGARLAIYIYIYIYTYTDEAVD
jgi:hypothetical protein